MAEALSAVEDTGEHFYEAELQRLRGEFLLQRSADNQREAEAALRDAGQLRRIRVVNLDASLPYPSSRDVVINKTAAPGIAKARLTP